jgi:type IV pilus assembly protein PilC
MIDIPETVSDKENTIQRIPKEKPFWNREISFAKTGLTDRKKERFYSELHILLIAGVDMRTAFELLSAEAERKEERELYAQILSAIVGGATFPDAIQQTGKFSLYEYFSLRIGEESGRMNLILQDLALYYAKKIKQKRKVVAALSYPLIVICIAVLAVIFMLRFVVPMFADMLSRFGTELPALTKGIIAASDAVGVYGPWIVLTLFSVVVFFYLNRKSDSFRRMSSAVLLRIPYLGKVVQKIYIERFAHAMHLLLISKTNLLDALDLVQKMVGFYPIETSLVKIRQQVLAGKTLNESLGEFPIYPRRMISLIRVAEEVNQVDMMFDKLSVQLSEEIEHETALLGSVIEPLMILFLGVLVAVILVAMYLPMFKMGEAF